ncbi:hypothetical protein AVEN_206789-1 [Araneus ventricosus]|uniref:DDE-1 domain-containing protein n=1 Tax=Araneus ventricosus TaxID=182803 RepID=A0A4Y2C6F8_ARAVE|nr:hypothetical protein AVEN_206789-1 [Araneus ventricosus]
MVQGVLESLKLSYQKKLIRKLLFEGESASIASILEFWNSVNIKDCIYMISEAWESVPQLTLRRSWPKLLPEFSNIFNMLPGFENFWIKEITDWLNCDMEDAGFQFLNDEEIITEVRHSPKEEGEDEGENNSQVKISNNDAFECFSKILAWLEQEQSDSSELLL